jgi:hypothetical protein
MTRWPGLFVLLALSSTVAALHLSGCGFAFDRELKAGEGRIIGRAIRADLDEKPPAVGAQIRVYATPIARSADKDGKFTIGGLPAGDFILQIKDDADGDYWPERTYTVATRLDIEPHPSGLVSSDDPAITSVSVGTLQLDGVFSLAGAVTGDFDRTTHVARLVVNRSACPMEDGLVMRDVEEDCSKDLNEEIPISAEAVTAASADGSFSFHGLGSGTVFVHALLYEISTNADNPGAIVAALPPVAVKGTAGEHVSLSETFDFPAGPLPDLELRDVDVRVFPRPEAEEVFVVAGPPGAAFPPCEDVNLSLDGARGFRVYAHAGAADKFGIQALPVGEWDVLVCAGTNRGVVYRQILPASGGDAPVPSWGPILLSDVPECLWSDGDTGDKRDCDGDGVQGLPPIFPQPENADDQIRWNTCFAQCQDAFGEEGATITCQVGNEVYDCDDDADGQADTTEHPRCYGVGRGTDFDGDGLCAGTDPWPQCWHNTAEDCVAGEDDLRTRDPPQVGEGITAADCLFQLPPEPGVVGQSFCGMTGAEDTGNPLCGTLRVSCGVPDGNQETQCECSGGTNPPWRFSVPTGGDISCDADEDIQRRIWGRCLARWQCAADEMTMPIGTVDVVGANVTITDVGGQPLDDSALPAGACLDAEQVTVTSAASDLGTILGLDGLKAILGDLAFASNGANDLTLTGLQAVGGDFTVENNASLQTFAAPLLAVVGGEFLVSQNDGLSVPIGSPDLFNPGGNNALWFGGGVNITGNDLLSTTVADDRIDRAFAHMTGATLSPPFVVTGNYCDDTAGDMCSAAYSTGDVCTNNLCGGGGGGTDPAELPPMSISRAFFALFPGGGTTVQAVAGISGTPPSAYLSTSEVLSEPASAGSWNAGPDAVAQRFDFGFAAEPVLAGVEAVSVGGDMGTIGIATESTDILFFDGAAWNLANNGLFTGRIAPEVVRADDGIFWVVGGYDFNGNGLVEVTEIDMSADPFNPTVTPQGNANLITGRRGHTATLYGGNLIVVVGGDNPGDLSGLSGTATNIEVIDTATASQVTETFPTLPRAGHTATLLQDGRILITGGADSTGMATNTGFIFERLGVNNSTLTPTTNNMTFSRIGHTATLLPDGRVVIAGGQSGTSFRSQVDIFDPSTDTFSDFAGTNLGEARAHHAAVEITPYGAVICGGCTAANGPDPRECTAITNTCRLLAPP